jgi:hypothetical protein
LSSTGIDAIAFQYESDDEEERQIGNSIQHGTLQLEQCPITKSYSQFKKIFFIGPLVLAGQLG